MKLLIAQCLSLVLVPCLAIRPTDLVVDKGTSQPGGGLKGAAASGDHHNAPRALMGGKGGKGYSKKGGKGYYYEYDDYSGKGYAYYDDFHFGKGEGKGYDVDDYSYGKGKGGMMMGGYSKKGKGKGGSYFDHYGKGFSGSPMCSAHDACKHLAGHCCPTFDGVFLDCCRYGGGKGKGGDEYYDGKGKGKGYEDSGDFSYDVSQDYHDDYRFDDRVGDSKDYGKHDKCYEVRYVASIKDITEGSKKSKVGSKLQFQVYEASDTKRAVGVYTDAGIDLDDSECVFTGAVSKDYNKELGTYDSQLNFAGTCKGTLNSVTGGSGDFACANGYGYVSNDKIPADGYVSFVFKVCQGTCAPDKAFHRRLLTSVHGSEGAVGRDEKTETRNLIESVAAEPLHDEISNLELVV